jgi:CO/xanthine dehydrogenase Mo-binding subunit
MQLIGMPIGALGVSDQIDSSNGHGYHIPNRRYVAKTVPTLNGYLKSSKLRSVETPQSFGIEIFIDELAYAAGMDPLAFRRQNASKATTHGYRWLGILNALEEAANWQPRPAASRLSDDAVVTGRGIAASPRKEPPEVSFVGAIVDIEVNKKTGKILVKRLYGVQDQGLTVNPEGLENQIFGQAIQAVSMALYEQTQFSTSRVTSLDWVTYPILRFKEAPHVIPIVVQRPEVQMSGAGDYLGSIIPSAIANAFFDATGVRIRQNPMTPAVVRATLAARGEGTAGVK